MNTEGKLNPEFKARWLTALRSGEIRQAQKALCDGEGMCCLGVAAFIADPFAWEATLVRELSISRFVGENDYNPGSYNYFYSEKLGMTDEMRSNLARMNDNGKTFVEIADYIEENY